MSVVEAVSGTWITTRVPHADLAPQQVKVNVIESTDTVAMSSRHKMTCPGLSLGVLRKRLEVELEEDRRQRVRLTQQPDGFSDAGYLSDIDGFRWLHAQGASQRLPLRVLLREISEREELQPFDARLIGLAARLVEVAVVRDKERSADIRERLHGTREVDLRGDMRQTLEHVPLAEPGRSRS